MDINNLEKFKATVASGRTALGACIGIKDATVCELAADAGFDFTWIDMEHNPLTLTDVMHLVMALRGTDCAPFVRVPWNEFGVIKTVIDLAPAGVIVPMVNTPEQAAAAVAACRYPPRGTRGCGMRRNIRYGARPVTEYLALSEHEPLVIVQIEHIDAVSNLDRILAVPGLDSICIGPYDLSGSMGKLSQVNDPEVVAVIDEICAKTLKTNVMLGAFGVDYPVWRRRGVHWTALGNDADVLFVGYRRLLQDCGDKGVPA